MRRWAKVDFRVGDGGLHTVTKGRECDWGPSPVRGSTPHPILTLRSCAGAGTSRDTLPGRSSVPGPGPCVRAHRVRERRRGAGGRTPTTMQRVVVVPTALGSHRPARVTTAHAAGLAALHWPGPPSVRQALREQVSCRTILHG